MRCRGRAGAARIQLATRALLRSDMQKKNIDPDIELKDDDEEPSLPELPDVADEPGMEIDWLPGTGTGRNIIAEFARHAPSAPGVYRMTGAGGDVLYVGKAKNLKKRILAYARPTGHVSRIARMVAATSAHRVRLHRDRNRGAAARSQPDQAAAAALQRAAARRQVVSLHPHHRRRAAVRRSASTAAPATATATISGRSPRSMRSTAPSPRSSAPS